MIAVISTIIAFLSSMLPLIFQGASKWMDVKKELQIKQMEHKLASEQLQAQRENFANQAKLADIIATLREGESLRSHDDSLTGEGFVGVLRALVRPIVTYLLLSLWGAVKFISLYKLMYVQNMAIADAVPLLLDENTQALIGAVFGFWFGSRMLEKGGYK